MFFLNYILFILLILFVHVIALSTQSLSSKKYFFGVYVNEIIIEEDAYPYVFYLASIPSEYIFIFSEGNALNDNYWLIGL